MQEILDSIERGRFREVELLMEGLSYEKEIPNNYWMEYIQFFEPEVQSKVTLERVRRLLILNIAERIHMKKTKYGDLMNVDNYCRFFHALNLLKFNGKEMNILPKKNLNKRYKAAYSLWQLEQEGVPWKDIKNIAWTAAEIYKHE